MKILVLTSIYPSPESNPGHTSVVHYFTKEWVKKGHQVKVIHNQSKFFGLFYKIPKIIRNTFESKFGFSFPVYKMTSIKRYKIELVNIHRIPIFKLFPFLKFSKSALRNQVAKIYESNNEDKFSPDIIVSHWPYPQLPIMIDLKKLYACGSVLVIHGGEYINSQSRNKVKTLLNEVDYIGFRSEGIKKYYELLFGLPNKYFMCYSGIKDDYLSGVPNKTYNNKLNNFLFVGKLIKRKHPDKIIIMLSEIYNSKSNFALDIVGIGPEKKNLVKLSQSKNLTENIRFHSQLERDEVLRKMAKSECFIMISEGEAFGLVYLEAMSKGCIVVASRNEGMDGIIIDKFNGFLCEAGNYNELCLIIDFINNLTIEEKMQISRNAFNTAFAFRESKVAQDYLNKIVG